MRSLILLAAVLGYSLIANAAPIAPQGCTCSKPTSSVFGQGADASEAYIANCWCPPQMCAAMWNKRNATSSVSLACVPSDLPPLSAGNCIEFTKQPAQSITGSKMFGGFSVVKTSIKDWASVSIQLSELLDESGKETVGPIALQINPSAQIVFPRSSPTVEIRYINLKGAPFTTTWTNSAGEFKTELVGTNQPQGRILSHTITDQAGLDHINLFSDEYYYVSFCLKPEEQAARARR